MDQRIISREIKNTMNQTTYKNLWETVKTVAREVSNSITYIKKEKKSQVNNLSTHFKNLKKKRKANPR